MNDDPKQKKQNNNNETPDNTKEIDEELAGEKGGVSVADEDIAFTPDLDDAIDSLEESDDELEEDSDTDV